MRDPQGLQDHLELPEIRDLWVHLDLWDPWDHQDKLDHVANLDYQDCRVLMDFLETTVIPVEQEPKEIKDLRVTRDLLDFLGLVE